MAGIQCLAGQPRSGKSYTSIELFMLPALREGRQIVTNVSLKMDAINADFPGNRIQHIDDLTAVDWDSVGGGCLLIIDEVWRLWPQGKMLKNIPLSQMAMLKEHGHRPDDKGRAMDVVLITQDANDLAKPVRSLIESTVITVKHLDLGIEDAAIRYYCRRAAGFQADGTPPKGQIIKSENIKYKADVYKYYKTQMNSDGLQGPNETRIVKNSLFGSGKFKAGVAVVVAMIVVMGWAALKTGDNINKRMGKPNAAGDLVAVETSTVVVQPTKPAIVLPNYSQIWRLAGTLDNYGGSGQTMYVIVNNVGAIRRIKQDLCTMDGYEEQCTLDGEIIARYTGGGTVSPGYAAAPIQAVLPGQTEPQPVAMATTLPANDDEQEI